MGGDEDGSQTKAAAEREKWIQSDRWRRRDSGQGWRKARKGEHKGDRKRGERKRDRRERETDRKDAGERQRDIETETLR